MDANIESLLGNRKPIPFESLATSIERAFHCDINFQTDKEVEYTQEQSDSFSSPAILFMRLDPRTSVDGDEQLMRRFMIVVKEHFLTGDFGERLSSRIFVAHEIGHIAIHCREEHSTAKEAEEFYTKRDPDMTYQLTYTEEEEAEAFEFAFALMRLRHGKYKRAPLNLSSIEREVDWLDQKSELDNETKSSMRRGLERYKSNMKYEHFSVPELIEEFYGFREESGKHGVVKKLRHIEDGFERRISRTIEEVSDLSRLASTVENPDPMVIERLSELQNHLREARRLYLGD